MSEVIKGPWAGPGDRATAKKVPGSDWATGLVEVPRVAPVPAFRPLTAADQQLLWRWLRLALGDPPPAVFAEDWGRPTDMGCVAVIDGKDAGACWLRLLPEGVGLASVDAVTPQLSIALEPQYRRQGIGRTLIVRALREAWDRGYRQISLAIHPDDPAVGVYAVCGFEKIGKRGSYDLMLATTAP